MSANLVNIIQTIQNYIHGCRTEQGTPFNVVAPFNGELLSNVIEVSTEIMARLYADLTEPIAWINAREFGLNCGIFTDSLGTAWFAIRQIQCDGVTINSTSTFRPDQLLYEVIKNSGLGRDGPGCAVLELTNQKLAVFAT